MNPTMLRSTTFWGGLIYMVLDYAAKQGAIPSGTAESLSQLAQNLAGLVALWGLRRRLPA